MPNKIIFSKRTIAKGETLPNYVVETLKAYRYLSGWLQPMQTRAHSALCHNSRARART